MAIKLEESKVKCFACETHKDPIRVLMDIENFETYSQGWQFLKIQQEYEAYERVVAERKIVKVKKLKLPEGFRLISMGDDIMGVAARHYLEKKRGFNITKLALAGVGYCVSGEYAGYIIFPYYKHGRLIYFQGRLYMGPGTKMKNPIGEEFGVGKSNIIYNEDALFIYNRINVLESITNCLTLGNNSIGINGKSISDYQLSKLIQSPCQYVVIILDPDAIDKAFALAMKVAPYKKVKVVIMPNNCDVNDKGRSFTRKLIKETPYQNYMELFRENLKLKSGDAQPINTYQRVGPYYSSSRGAM